MLLAVGERVQEREHARPPVRLGEREERDRGDAEPTPTTARWRVLHAAGDEHGEHDEREHDRRAEVGLASSRAAAKPPSTSSTGLHHAPPVVRARRPRRLTRSAAQSSSASLAISLGWKRNMPAPSQRREPDT